MDLEKLIDKTTEQIFSVVTAPCAVYDSKKRDEEYKRQITMVLCRAFGEILDFMKVPDEISKLLPMFKARQQ